MLIEGRLFFRRRNSVYHPIFLYLLYSYNDLIFRVLKVILVPGNHIQHAVFTILVKTQTGVTSSVLALCGYHQPEIKSRLHDLLLQLLLQNEPFWDNPRYGHLPNRINTPDLSILCKILEVLYPDAQKPAKMRAP